MIINRDNYEEFFLLYVDKELEADGRAAVESFASQNPDLAKELEMLLQATLIDDNIQFPDKELLYKRERSITISNYEEYFLLSTDNELNEQQAAEVENFVLKHPQLQEEFTLLQKARVQPELITFPGKEKLYRQERNERRIIPLSLIRMSAAAAIVGIAYISFILINNKNSDDHGAAQVSYQPGKTVLKKNDTALAQKSVTEKTVDTLQHKDESSKNVKNVVINIRKVEKSNLKKFKEIKNQGETIADNKVKESKRKIQIEEPDLATVETTDKQQTPVEREIKSKGMNRNGLSEIVDDDMNIVVMNEPVTKEDKPLITHAVYLETDNVEEEKTLYIGSAQINKNKVKGLIRKAAGFFDKKIRGMIMKNRKAAGGNKNI